MKLLLTLRNVTGLFLPALVLLVAPGCEKKECSTKMSTPSPVQKVVTVQKEVKGNTEPTPSVTEAKTESEEHKVIEITGKEAFDKFLAEAPIAIIDFTATWCPPCRKLAPELEKIAVDYESKGVKVAKVDVDKNKDLSSEYGVSGIPDVRIAVKGKIVGQVIGFNPPELIAKLASAIAKEANKDEEIIFNDVEDEVVEE